VRFFIHRTLLLGFYRETKGGSLIGFNETIAATGADPGLIAADGGVGKRVFSRRPVDPIGVFDALATTCENCFTSCGTKEAEDAEDFGTRPEGSSATKSLSLHQWSTSYDDKPLK